MADLKYNNVWLDLIKTESYAADPVYDPSGVDLECVKVTIQVRCIFHDYWLGGGKVDGSANHQSGKFSFGHRGWTAGVSLANLRQTLMQPRGHLQFWIGSTLVLEAPMRDQANVLYHCDVRGGPFPQDCTVTEIIGTRAAVVTFRIEAFVSVCDHYVLSNRWRMESNTDEYGYATNIIHGRASFRHDFMHRAGLHADDFRKWLILPPDQFMKRDAVQVSMSEDGGTLNYTVVDRQVNYGTGEGSGIAKVGCQITGGIESPIKSYKGFLDSLVKMGKTAFALGPWGAFGEAIELLVGQAVPVCKLNGVVQIWGQLGASREYLLNTAISMLLDRIGVYRPGQVILGKGSMVSMFATLDWSSDGPPYVELRGEFLAAQKFFMSGSVKKKFDFNFQEKIDGDPGLRLFWDASKPTVELPNGGNTRALRACRLVTQVLTEPTCQRPGDPPAIGQGGRSVVAANTGSANG